MSLSVRALTGPALDAALPDLAALRIAVFRDWPYLYDGSVAYEERYLRGFAASAGAILIGAFDGDTLVGAATGAPLEDHATAFGAAFADASYPLTEVFYCAESVLLPDWRGQGVGHRFFDLREDHARALNRRRVVFCSVVRPVDHPLRPQAYRPHDAFWRARGYAPLPGVVAQYSWTDLGQPHETDKPMQFWGKSLAA